METVENGKMRWVDKGISRAALRSDARQAKEAYKTKAKNEVNLSAVKKIERRLAWRPRQLTPQSGRISYSPRLSKQWTFCARLKSATSSSLKHLEKIQRYFWIILNSFVFFFGISLNYTAVSLNTRGTYHFPKTSFHRLIVFLNNDFADRHFTPSLYIYIRIVKLKKINNPGRYFLESSFSRTSFSRIVV